MAAKLREERRRSSKLFLWQSKYLRSFIYGLGHQGCRRGALLIAFGERFMMILYQSETEKLEGVLMLSFVFIVPFELYDCSSLIEN